MLAHEICVGSSLTVGDWRVSLGAVSRDTRAVHICFDLPDPSRRWLRYRHAMFTEVAVGENFRLPNGVIVWVDSAKQKAIRLRLDNPSRLPIVRAPYKGPL